MCIYDFVAKDENTYQIDLEDEYIEVRLYGEVMGSISLDWIQNDDHLPDYYYITDLSLEKCKRLGIGSECLRLHQEEIGVPI